MVSLEDIKRLWQGDDEPKDVADFFGLKPEEEDKAGRTRTSWTTFWRWLGGR